MRKTRANTADIKDDFLQSMSSYWTQVCVGGGNLSVDKSRLRLGFESAQKDHYTDAQIDDYTMLPRSQYLWKPPLRMTVRARFSLAGATAENTPGDTHIMKGTAGFGFWNNPFSLRGDVHALPEAIWFFYSAPPANTALVPGVPGWGWKAQSIHTKRPGMAAFVIPTTLAVAYGRIKGDSTVAGKWVQRLAGAAEAPVVQDMRTWHTYTLEWRAGSSTFSVDGELILRTGQSPTQPLGFVAWVDNQYTVATPEGVFEFGKVKTGPQWMEVDSIHIEKL